MVRFTTLAEFDAHIESTPYPRLLGGNEPILATVIEKRDNVAQLINHRKQNLAFASLVVSL